MCAEREPRPAVAGAHRARRDRLTVDAGARRHVWRASTARPLGWLGLALAIGVGALIRGIGVYDAPAPDEPEAVLVTQIATLSKGGAWAAGPVGLLPIRLMSLAMPQFAALTSVSGAWRRAPTELGAVRESAPLLWISLALLVWVFARRTGATRRWATVAVALLAICPAAVGASRVVAPENLATLWATAALALAVGRSRPRARGRPRAAAALGVGLSVTVLLTVAVLTAPVALGLTPAAPLAYRRHGVRGTALLAGGLLVTVAVSAAPLVSAAPGGMPSAEAARWFAPGWLGRDPVTPVVGLLVALISLRSPRRRPLAIGALTAVALAAPLGGSGALALPPVMVLIACLVQQSAAALSGRRATWLASGMVAAALALAWAGDLVELPRATAAPPIASARRWLADSVADPGQVRAALRDRVELVSGAAAPLAGDGPPIAPGGCVYPNWWQPAAGARDSSGGCADPIWWVWTSAGSRDRPPPPGAEVIATFGPPGRDRVWVGATGLGAADPARELAARRAAGAALAASPQLRADPSVMAQLRDGQLDSRALSTLAAALSRQRLRLLALPVVAGEVTPRGPVDRPLHQLLLVPDGPPPEGAGSGPPVATQAIAEFFAGQLAPFRPHAVSVLPAGVLVRYSPLAPQGLLEAFLRP
jgi:hypothetical protein